MTRLFISADKTPFSPSLKQWQPHWNYGKRSMICNLAFPAQKATSPWQSTVTCKSLWSIRIHNMSQFPMKKFKISILGRVNETVFSGTFKVILVDFTPSSGHYKALNSSREAECCKKLRLLSKWILLLYNNTSPHTHPTPQFKSSAPGSDRFFPTLPMAQIWHH